MKADEQDSSFTVESNHGSVESIADGEEDDKLLPEKSNDADDGGASRKRSLGSFGATGPSPGAPSRKSLRRRRRPRRRQQRRQRTRLSPYR